MKNTKTLSLVFIFLLPVNSFCFTINLLRVSHFANDLFALNKNYVRPMALLFFILNYKYISSLNILIHNRLTYQLLTLCEHLIHIHIKKKTLKEIKKHS